MTRTNPRTIVLPVLPASPGPGTSGHAAVAPGPAHEDGLRVSMVTLGCDKNTVDSERILAVLLASGVRVSDAAEDADVVLVNTCGFIEVARQESIETLLEAVQLKRTGSVRAVVAMGCLVQRYKDELTAELPEVDLFLGLTEVGELVPQLQRRGLLPERPPLMERPLRALSTSSRHTSFLKISEGCDHTCAFCAIPLMRGRFRSTPIETLVAEARELERRGVVELNLVSQDSTWYGRDWRRGVRASSDDYYIGRSFPRMAGAKPPAQAESNTEGLRARPAMSSKVRADDGIGSGEVPPDGALPQLLRKLLVETRIPWLRLFYMYPSGISRDLVELMATEPRIVPYLDMPIQHGSDAVLRRMRRPERRSTILERVGWLRDALPHVALRTTVIVGFPGETEDDFDALLDLLEELRFDRLGAFAYSPEEGTPAAEMEGQVPVPVRRERLERLQDLQRIISLERNETRLGSDTLVLVDRPDSEGGDGVVVGRTAAQAVEVDGVVRVEGARGARAGDFVRARLTEAREEDLIGVAIERDG